MIGKLPLAKQRVPGSGGSMWGLGAAEKMLYTGS